ncbi:fibroblast growth factor 10 [Oryzias melastigma]|nr:fibroblast growth factor 10 [Oryzias melastigma]
MLTHSCGAFEEQPVRGTTAESAAAPQAPSTSDIPPVSRGSFSHSLFLSLQPTQHAPALDHLHSSPSSTTMCRWTVTQGAPVAWFSSCLCCRPPSHLLSLSFILLLLLLGPPTSSSPLLASLSMNSEQNHNAQRPSFSHFFISHSPPSSTPPPPASSARLPWAINVSSSSTAIVGRHVRSSYKHLQGDVRKRKLVSFKYFFLRIGENGAINGTENEDDQYCELEIKSVEVGVVAIKGRKSNRYLAIRKDGLLYGAKKYGPDCHLIERIEENKYNTYASAEWRNKKKFMFVAINAKGKPINATKTRKTKKVTHFLPTLVEP